MGRPGEPDGQNAGRVAPVSADRAALRLQLTQAAGGRTIFGLRGKLPAYGLGARVDVVPGRAQMTSSETTGLAVAGFGGALLHPGDPGYDDAGASSTR